MPRANGAKTSLLEPRYQQFESFLASLQADACVIGLFTEEHELATHPWVVMHRLRAGDLTEESIYDLLFGGSFSGFRTFFVDHPLKRNAFLRGVLLKRAVAENAFPAGVGERLREMLQVAVEPDRLSELLAESPRKIALERRNPSQVAMMLLDENLNVYQRWYAKPGDRVFGSAVRVPIYIEEPLRRVSKLWKQHGASSEPVVFSPVPHLVVRAYPMDRDGTVHTLLTIENVQVRVALQRAQREHHLSARESEVLRYLFEGYRVEEIADALSLAEATVQDHIKRAITKAGVRNRVQLAARILGWDLATSPE